MDKYEYRVKTEQMLEHMEKRQYKKAEEIADTIDWRRVKNASMLSTVSEIYEMNGEFQKSRDVLLMAFDRSPGSRKIVYRLGTLALKINDVDEASDCYEEFVKLAPKDPNQYILKYKILKAQGSPLSEQIDALSDFKKAEYVEKWAYELAKLYHDAGMTAECLEECDDLILWFSEGKYVYQAMELKMKYKPLTPLQQEKYDEYKGVKKTGAKRAGVSLRPASRQKKEPDPRPATQPVPDVTMEFTELPGVGTAIDEVMAGLPDEQESVEADATRRLPTGELSAALAAMEAQNAAAEAQTVQKEENQKEPEYTEEQDYTEEQNYPEGMNYPEEDNQEEQEYQDSSAEEPEAEMSVAREKKSSIATVVKGATLEEALFNGVAMANGINLEEKKRMAQREEELRISGQMRIEDILQEWEEKQKVNAEAIEEQKAKDEERLKKEREAARERREAERLEAERKEAEEVARRREAEEAKRKAEKAAAEEAARKAAEEAARREAERAAEEEAARKAAEEAARREAEEEAEKAAAEEAARKEAERAAEEAARKKAEKEAKRKAKEKKAAEEAARKEAEEKTAKREAKEKADRKKKTTRMVTKKQPILSDDIRQLVEELEGRVSENEKSDFDSGEELELAKAAPEESYQMELNFMEEDMPAEESGDEDEFGGIGFGDEFSEEGFEDSEEFAGSEYEDEDEPGEEGFEDEDEFGEDGFEDGDEFDEGEFDEDEFEEFEDEDELVENGFEDEDEFEEEEFDEDEFDEDEFDEDAFSEDEFDEDEFDGEDFFDDELPEIVRSKDDEPIEFDEPSEEEIQKRIKKAKGSGVPFDTGFVVTGRYDLSATSEIGLKAGLTEEQKKLFSYFVPVRGMSEQIVEVLDNDRRAQREGTSRTGNLLVIGRKGSGKTVLAIDIVKAIQKQRNLKQGKVAIVTGESLNKKELSNIIQKLRGGAIVIEKAGKLNSRTIKELSVLMEKKTGEMLFVLEDQRKPLERILTAHPDFKKKFTSRLELPVFINDELVTFGQTYAKENGYKLDEMGILALYSRIDVMQREDHAVTVAEVKEIMDAAIEHSQKANMKHLARRVFGRGTDESDRIILKEEDFKH